jgi:hypothetical protein
LRFGPNSCARVQSTAFLHPFISGISARNAS